MTQQMAFLLFSLIAFYPNHPLYFTSWLFIDMAEYWQRFKLIGNTG
jgi:hypothetical protein